MCRNITLSDKYHVSLHHWLAYGLKVDHALACPHVHYRKWTERSVCVIGQVSMPLGNFALLCTTHVN